MKLLLAITLFLSTSCGDTVNSANASDIPKAPASSKLNFKCMEIGHDYIRCENREVVCYHNSYHTHTLSCVAKMPKVIIKRVSPKARRQLRRFRFKNKKSMPTI